VPGPVFHETTVRLILIVAGLLWPLQARATPSSLPVKDSVVPLKLSRCEAAQWLEEAVHEPPGLQAIRSGRGPETHWSLGEHSFTCGIIV